MRKCFILLFFFGSISLIFAKPIEDNQNRTTALGISLGNPAVLNLALLRNFGNYSLRLSGAYYGDKTNTLLANGIQIELLRPIHSSSIKHYLSFMYGHHTYGHSVSNQLNYIGIGYNLSWKAIYYLVGFAYPFNSNENHSSRYFITQLGFLLYLR